MMDSWTVVQTCGAIGVACAAWNLLGDLYYMDFYTAHMSIEEFGMIRLDGFQRGYLFQFDSDFSWIAALFAQAGGWMYPIWAVVTVFPLYLGMYEKNSSGFWRNNLAPLAVLAYGLCVIGGGLHSAYAYVTVVPNVYYHPPASANGWSDLQGTDEFAFFLQTAQRGVVQRLVIGCLPGMLACNVASLWIGILVQLRRTRFPRWFNFFNPVTTSIWVQILSFFLPEPIGFYFTGCLGTWGVLILNLGTTYCLRNLDARGIETMATLLQQGHKSEEPSHQNYDTLQSN